MSDIHITEASLPGGLTAIRCEPPGGSAKTPVLLCHGWMSGAWQWSRLQPFLARRGYASLAINYRGHCGSAPVSDLAAVTFADFLADAQTAAATLGRPIAIGQSTGGLIVQKLAEAAAVTAAVLSCSVPPAGIRWRSATSAIDDLRKDSDTLRQQVVPPDRPDFDTHVYNRMPTTLADEAFAQQVPESGRVLAELFNQEIGVDEHKVSCPVLSVVGGDDRLVSQETDLAVAAKYGGLSIVRPHAGHYALVYEPGWEQTADMVMDWLDRVAD
jgi:pimeloyl-ACP methyl ester carboxylesterase